VSRAQSPSSNPRRSHRFVWLAVAAAALGGVGYGMVEAAESVPGRIAAIKPSARARVHRDRRRVAGLLSLPRVPPHRSVWLPILMYHRIGPLNASLPAITRALTVTPQGFDAQMHWLVTHGFHAVTQLQAFDALERGDQLPPRPVMITFDDGYRDVLWNAAPVLKHLGLPATAYVITGRVSGPDPSFLTWPELRKLEADGITVGSHTVHHRGIPSLSTRGALAELKQSRRALERHLRHFVQWFAYPFGAENAHAVELVRQAGYVLAVTTRPGAEQNASAPLELRRYEVLDTTGVAGLRGLVDHAP
jgi:peptidoglycan/xylan/chitin deacetylase (PgdA/CDA1 family)